MRKSKNKSKLIFKTYRSILQKKIYASNVIFALILGCISYFRLLDTYELILLDLRFKTRPIQKINPEIAIVEIGNDTLTDFGCWPLPRDYHATLIKVLSDCGVRAIVFDVIFAEPTENDALLAQAVKRAANVYFPYSLRLENIKNSFWQASQYDATILPSLEKAAKDTGFANVLTDSDGKRRRIPLLIKYKGEFLPQLTFQAACDYLGNLDEIQVLPGKFVQLGDNLRIPIDAEGAVLVNMAGKWKDTFKHYSYCEILITYAQKATLGEDQPPLLAQLKDKVCFIGLTATGTADINPTALEPVYPMVGLHANLFNSITTKNFLSRAPRLLNLAILYILCIATFFATMKKKPLIGVLYQLGLIALFMAFGFLLFLLAGVWVDLFLPIITCVVVYLGTNIFRYIRELHSRELLEKELSIARNIQRSFLRELPQGLEGVEISVDMETAKHVGGDLYDFVRFEDGRVGLMVGDVSGKGVPAALFMAQVISQFRNFANTCASPAETLTKLNNAIARESKSGLFVTVVYLIYNPSTGEVVYASGGHLPAFVFRNGQLIDKVDVQEGMPIGLIEESGFSEKTLTLEKGDLVLLYSDGVTEARNKQRKDFEEERIISALKDQKELSSQQAVELLKGAISAFVGRAPQHDDITIMALRAV
jgi:adenylate cyclase